MSGRQRPAGAAERGRDLEQAAGVRADVEVGLGREHVRRLAVAERARRLRLDEVVDAGAAAAELLLGRLDELEPGDRAEQRTRLARAPAGRGRGGRTPGRRRGARADDSSGACPPASASEMSSDGQARGRRPSGASRSRRRWSRSLSTPGGGERRRRAPGELEPLLAPPGMELRARRSSRGRARRPRSRRRRARVPRPG